MPDYDISREFPELPDIQYKSYGVTYDGLQENNFLGRNYFQLEIPRIPNFGRFVQSVTLPQFSFSQLEQPTTLGLAPAFPGSGYEFAPLVIGFGIDERFLSYQELFRWMESMAFLTDTHSIPQEAQVSDIILSIKNSAYNEKVKVIFKDAFPLTLSSLEFTSLEPSASPLIGSVTFSYSNFDIVQSGV